MFTLANDLLEISVKKVGAELCNITSAQNKTEFMWQANPAVWANHAPNLFPIVGGLKNNTFFFEGQPYEMTKHGFIRNNENIELIEQTIDTLTFKLTYNEKTLKYYPFKFEYFVKYVLKDNKLAITYSVKNLDDKAILFSVGGHPAFTCPVFENESYSDYYLEFEKIENSKTHLLDMANGLVSLNTAPVFNNSNKIELSHNLFVNDALIFKDLKSKKISLKSKLTGTILSLDYEDFDYLGIWAKPNGDFVCIEPWLGIADSVDTNQEFNTKEGIIRLDVNNTFEATYGIEIIEDLLR